MFCVMLYFYAQKLMGGGDVKILTVGFLWVGFRCALPFAVLLAIFATLHVVAAKFGWAQVQQVGDKKRIPLAPSVAGALILCFILGCLQPISSPASSAICIEPLHVAGKRSLIVSYRACRLLQRAGKPKLPARNFGKLGPNDLSQPCSCACHPCFHSVAPRTVWFLHFAQW